MEISIISNFVFSSHTYAHTHIHTHTHTLTHTHTHTHARTHKKSKWPVGMFNVHMGVALPKSITMKIDLHETLAK